MRGNKPKVKGKGFWPKMYCFQNKLLKVYTILLNMIINYGPK